MLQHAFDEPSESFKTKVVDTEMQIELSAEDGDSVTAISRSITHNKKMEPISCAGFKEASLYSTGGSLQLEISPSDTEDIWFVCMSAHPSKMYGPRQICARRMRLTGDGEGYVVANG